MRNGTYCPEAVSPVVGVMLMLAVTVMIAAVVSTYAGGFSGNADKSPQCSLRATPDGDLHRIYFDHNGGDPFTLRSIMVVLRSGDNKTSLFALDAGSSKVLAFEEVGSTSSDSTVKAGDTFFIEGLDSGGPGPGMKFGTLILTNNTRTSWTVIDQESGKTIATGAFYL